MLVLSSTKDCINKNKEKKRETFNEIDGENITLLTEKSFAGNLMTFNQVGAICIKQLFHKIECYTELGMNSYRDVFFPILVKRLTKGTDMSTNVMLKSSANITSFLYQIILTFKLNSLPTKRRHKYTFA